MTRVAIPRNAPTLKMPTLGAPQVAPNTNLKRKNLLTETAKALTMPFAAGMARTEHWNTAKAIDICAVDHAIHSQNAKFL
jgi:predicted nucleic acid-binding Zn ribbon protein